MLRSQRWNGMKKSVAALLFATATVTAVGVTSTASAAGSPRTWSVVAHFRQIDGFEYDYTFATGVPTSELSDYLSACGESHRNGFAVWYHCYPVPE